MNEKAILEIADIIRAKRNWKLQLLSAKEILGTYEYKMFKRKYPELCHLIEKEMG